MKKYQNRKTILFCIVSLILISFITYKEVLGYYFIDVDTFFHIWASQIQSYKDVLRIFSDPLGGGSPFYRPISKLSYSIDHLIWEDNPFGYHLTDLLIHSLNTILVFWFAVVLFSDSKKKLLCAWLSAFLFSISPINISVVPSISIRHDTVAGFFLILCLLAASKSILGNGHKRLWYILSLFSGVLSIFSKESAYVLPFILGSYCFIFSDGTDYMKRLKDALKYAIPLIAVVFFNFILHLHIVGRLPAVHERLSLHIKSGAKFLFYLADPMGLIKIGNYAKVLIFIILSCGFVILLLFILVKKKGGFLELILSDSYKCYTFLLLYMAIFGIFYMVYGRVGLRYIYMPNIAFTLFIARVVFHPSKSLFAVSITKVLSLTIISYIVLFSPLFTQYTAWGRSSEITRKTFGEIKKAVTTRFTGKDSPTIYLLNLPINLEYKSDFKIEMAGILMKQSMVAWAKMSESNDFPYVEFIILSYAKLFYSPHADPGVDYLFDDNRIYVKSRNVRMRAPRFNNGQRGDEPIRFRFNDKEGELTFNRDLMDNELLLLFDGENIEIIDEKWLANQRISFKKRSAIQKYNSNKKFQKQKQGS